MVLQLAVIVPLCLPGLCLGSFHPHLCPTDRVGQFCSLSHGADDTDRWSGSQSHPKPSIALKLGIGNPKHFYLDQQLCSPWVGFHVSDSETRSKRGKACWKPRGGTDRRLKNTASVLLIIPSPHSLSLTGPEGPSANPIQQTACSHSQWLSLQDSSLYQASLPGDFILRSCDKTSAWYSWSHTPTFLHLSSHACLTGHVLTSYPIVYNPLTTITSML